jgi:hypothetical protein
MKLSKATVVLSDLAKEHLFDEICDSYFDVNNESKEFQVYHKQHKNSNAFALLNKVFKCTQPTLELLRLWFQLKHEIVITVYPKGSIQWYDYVINDFKSEKTSSSIESFDGSDHALESALYEAFKILKERK